jgi:hypothetical protein
VVSSAERALGGIAVSDAKGAGEARASRSSEALRVPDGESGKLRLPARDDGQLSEASAATSPRLERHARIRPLNPAIAAADPREHLARALRFEAATTASTHLTTGPCSFQVVPLRLRSHGITASKHASCPISPQSTINAACSSPCCEPMAHFIFI